MTRWHHPRALLAAGSIPVVLMTAVLTTAVLTTATAATAAQPGGILSVVAGGTGGPDPAANVSMEPCGVKFARGQLYIGGTTAVYRVSQATGRLVSVAGSGPWESSSGSTNNAVPAADAQLTTCGIATDAAGSLLLANGTSVRVVAAKSGTYYGQQMTAGSVYTIATGFNDAVDVEPDASGNLVVADQGTPYSQDNPEVDAVVWVIAERTGTFYGQQMTAGHRYLVAWSSFDGALCNGVPAATVDLGVGIGDVRPDRAGNLVIADTAGGGGSPYGNSGPSVPPAVRVVAANSGTFYGQRMQAGRIYTIAGGLFGQVGNAVPALKSALTNAAGIAFDHDGNVVVADGGTVRVIAVGSGTFYRQRMKAGYLYAIAGNGKGWGSSRFYGDGGPAANATIDPNSVAVDSDGNVLLGMIGRVLAVPERTGSSYGRRMTAGNIYSVAGTGFTQYSGDGGPAASAELLPTRVAWDRSADLVAAVDPLASVVRVVPSRTGTYFGRRMSAGDIYTIAGDGSTGYAGLGGPAAAAAIAPGQTTVDSAGNVLITAADLNVSSLHDAALLVVPDRSGLFYGQQMTAGHLYAIAGPSTATPINGAASVAIDPSGNVALSDSGQIEVLAQRTGAYYGQQMTRGRVYVIAGDGTRLSGPAASVEVGFSDSLAIGGSDNLLLADSRSGRILSISR